MNFTTLRCKAMPPARIRYQHGLSLVELMVALAISTVILIALVQVFVNSRLIYNTDEGIARLQENGRFAMEFLARDIRMAGNMGCLGNIPSDPTELENITANFVVNSTISPIFDLARGGIEGFEFNGTGPGGTYSLPALYPATLVSNTVPALNTALLASAVAGSDVLVLRFMDGEGVPLVPPYTDAAQVFAAQPNDIEDNQILIATDCKRVAIFQATGVSASGGQTNISHASGGTPGNTCPNWGVGGCKRADFEKGGQLARFNTMVYYVGIGAYGGPSLIRRSWPTGTSRDDELVEGVENMQILYGLNSDVDAGERFGGSADQYVPANSVTDWSRVVSVRVALLVAGQISGKTSGQSERERDTATYSIAGVTMDPPANDLHQRRVFTATVKVRNR